MTNTERVKLWKSRNRLRVAEQARRRRQRIVGSRHEVPGTKVCPECGVERRADAFGKDRGRRDGLTRLCKGCRRLIRSERLKIKRAAEQRVPAAKQVCHYEAEGYGPELRKRLAPGLETYGLSFEDQASWCLGLIDPKRGDVLTNIRVLKKENM